jgi:hypothetical protein
VLRHTAPKVSREIVFPLAPSVMLPTMTLYAGYTGFDRDLSEEILMVVLKSVSAEQQEGYVRQLEAFAEANRERFGDLYGKYGPGGEFADESRCYLTHQPESVVVCERLDTVPMWLNAVWNDELDAELTLERFTNLWRYGLGPS